MAIINHMTDHRIPGGFYVKPGYMSFRFSGKIWHTSGNTSNGEVLAYPSGEQYSSQHNGRQRSCGAYLSPDDAETEEDYRTICEVIARASGISDHSPEKSPWDGWEPGTERYVSGYDVATMLGEIFSPRWVDME